MAPGREPGEVPVPVTGFAARTACWQSCSCGLIQDLPGRASRHRTTLPEAAGVPILAVNPRSYLRHPLGVAAVSMTEACAFDKIGRTSDSSGAKAVHRVRGSVPGLPVLPGQWLDRPGPHQHTQPEGRPVSGPQTLPPRASRVVPDLDRALDDPSCFWSIGFFVPLPGGARLAARLAAYLVKRGCFIRSCAFKRCISGTSSEF